jgi:hypothetical protein
VITLATKDRSEDGAGDKIHGKQRSWNKREATDTEIYEQGRVEAIILATKARSEDGALDKIYGDLDGGGSIGSGPVPTPVSGAGVINHWGSRTGRRGEASGRLQRTRSEASRRHEEGV